MNNLQKKRGYTLIELIIAVGLFSLIMLLSSGAYLVMIGLNRQAQGIATGIDGLSFALEAMTRDIRTGSNYCGSGMICTANSFSFRDKSGNTVTYALGSQSGTGGAPVGDITKNTVVLTDPAINITALTFSTTGTPSVQAGDYEQSRVTIVVSGTVSAGAGKTQDFTVQTGSTMRGPDL